MASADNANNLGAPAHGFGQDVSFAIQPGSVPNQQELDRAQPVQAGVIGSEQGRAMDHTIVAAKPPEDHTFNMLMDAGMELLGPKLKEEKTKAFVKGMQRAAQGEAVTDIVDNQPWYSRIFGGGDVVAGARAYSGHAAAAEAAGALEDQMHTLRTMSPDQAHAVFTKTINGSMTGDASTDAQIMLSLTNQLPALMRRQAKEHYAWNQSQAADAEAKSMVSGAKALQAAAEGTVFVDPATGQAAAGSTKPEEFAAQAQAWVQSIAPVAGRDAANWQISTAKTLSELARQGLFHSLSAFDKAGGFNALTEAQADTVRKTWESSEATHRALNEAPYIHQIAEIRAGMKYPTDGKTVNDYMKQMDDVNSAYTARTGSRLGIFTPEQRAQLATEGLETVRKDRIAAAKDATAAEKVARTAAEKDAMHVRAVSQTAGNFLSGIADPEADPTTTREAWRQIENRDPAAYKHAQIETFYNSGHVIDKQKAGQVQGAIQGAIDAANPDALLAVYKKEWLPLYTKGQQGGSEGASVADAYTGDEFGKKMRVFHNIVEQGDGYAAAALHTAFVLPAMTAKVSDDGKFDKALVSEVKTNLNYRLPEWWGTSERHGNIDLRPDQVSTIAGIAKKDVQSQMLDEHDVSTSTKVALSGLRRQHGAQILGGYFWLNPSNTKPLEKILDDSLIPSNKQAEALRDTLAAKYKAQDIEDDHVSLMRGPDSNGQARFVAVVTSRDGGTHLVPMTSEEITSTYKAAKVAASPETKRAAAKASTVTNPLTSMQPPTSKFGDYVP